MPSSRQTSPRILLESPKKRTLRQYAAVLVRDDVCGSYRPALDVGACLAELGDLVSTPVVYEDLEDTHLL